MASTKAYTSQFVALVMFALVMSEDRISMQDRRLEVWNNLTIYPFRIKSSKRNVPFQIIDGLRKLPEQIRIVLAKDQSVQQLAKELVNEVC